MKKIEKYIRNEKGSVTAVVLATVLFFIIVLSTAYMITMTLRKGQLRSEIVAKGVYEEDFEHIEEILDSLNNPTEEEKPDEPLQQLPENNITKPYFPGDNFTIVKETDLDNGLVIEDNMGNQYVWIEVPKTDAVYKTATLNIVEDSTGNFTDTQYTAIENDLKTYTNIYRNGTTFRDEYNSDKTTGLTSIEYANLKKVMLQSVYQNGGFWIGRYEAGVSQNRTIHVTVDTTTEIPNSKANQYPYTYVYCSEAQSLASRVDSGNYTSSLMFGVQWDLVLKYLETKGATQEELNGTTTGSTNWGNYRNTTYDITNKNTQYSENSGSSWLNTIPYTKMSTKSVLLTTGANEARNSKQNICDLAGNIWELTLEYSRTGTNPCAYRGGVYSNIGSTYSSSSRDKCGASASSSEVGFRVTIY